MPAHKGSIPWNKGKTGLPKQSPEIHAKRSASLKLAYVEGRRTAHFLGKPAWNKGTKGLTTHVVPPEVREQTRQRNIKRLATQATSATLPEYIFEQALITTSLSYQKQVGLPYIKPVSCVDFYLPEGNIAIYVDGDYWHTRTVGQMNKDQGHNMYLSKAGYKVYRIWESEIYQPHLLSSIITDILKLTA